MNKKVVIICAIAIVLSITVLTLSFITLSDTLSSINDNLKIEDSLSNLKDTKVVFSLSNIYDNEGDVLDITLSGPTTLTDSVSLSRMNGSSATIDNSAKNPQITNIRSSLSEYEDTVKYTFYAHNKGSNTAKLSSIKTSDIKCIPSISTESELVSSMCKNIELSITYQDNNYPGNTNNILTNSLNTNEYTKVNITLKNNNKMVSNSPEFTIVIDTIEFIYE